jgi:hypothetical protein
MKLLVVHPSCLMHSKIDLSLEPFGSCVKKSGHLFRAPNSNGTENSAKAFSFVDSSESPHVKRGPWPRKKSAPNAAASSSDAPALRETGRTSCPRALSASTYHPPVDITGLIPRSYNTRQSAASILVQLKAVGRFHRSEAGCNRGILIQTAKTI